MKDWECTIKGVGPIGQGEFKGTADRILSRVTAELAEAGHAIQSSILRHSNGAGYHDLVTAPVHDQEDKVHGGDDDVNHNTQPADQALQSAPPADPGDDVTDLKEGDAGDKPAGEQPATE